MNEDEKLKLIEAGFAAGYDFYEKWNKKRNDYYKWQTNTLALDMKNDCQEIMKKVMEESK